MLNLARRNLKIISKLCGIFICPSLLPSQLDGGLETVAWSQGNRAAFMNKEFVFVSSNLSGGYLRTDRSHLSLLYLPWHSLGVEKQ